jgi:hypothetical protein
MTRPLEHRLDARLGRQHDRQHVGPAVRFEQPLEVVFGIGLDQPRRRPLERQPLKIASSSGDSRPSSTSCMNGRARSDPDPRCRREGRAETIDDRLRHVRLTEARHAHGERGCVAEPFEDVRVNGDGRNAVLLQCRGEPDDRRATGASKTDA